MPAAFPLTDPAGDTDGYQVLERLSGETVAIDELILEVVFAAESKSRLIWVSSLLPRSAAHRYHREFWLYERAYQGFFERIDYPCLEKTEGLPYAPYVRAGNDGAGAQSAVERIVTGLCGPDIQPCLVLKGDNQRNFEDDCEELGMFMADGLEAGVF